MSEWISVKDRLPDRGKLVIVTIEGCGDARGVGVSSWVAADGGQWYRFQEADEYNSDNPYFSDYGMEITHWMPLPEPPKEKVNG